MQRKKIYNIQEGLILKFWLNQLTWLRSKMAKGTREILLQAKCLFTCQLSETEPIPIITYLMLSKPLWIVIYLILGFF